MQQIVVITGGSRGIGAACARAFSGAGATVFCLSRHPDSPSSMQDAPSVAAGEIIRLPCDVTDSGMVRDVFGRILLRWGHVDVLVNNAGQSLIRQFQDTSEADWDSIFETHVKGAYRCIQAVLPSMLSRKSGAIVNIASMWGETGASCEVAYSSAKAALIGLTRALAKELGPSGIRVNCVSPGVIDTEMNRELDADTLAILAEDTPLCRIGTPEEVARAVCFLAGRDASFITGQVLGVSGGLVI